MQRQPGVVMRRERASRAPWGGAARAARACWRGRPTIAPAGEGGVLRAAHTGRPAPRTRHSTHSSPPAHSLPGRAHARARARYEHDARISKVFTPQHSKRSRNDVWPKATEAEWRARHAPLTRPRSAADAPPQSAAGRTSALGH
eukprot:5500551-Prymnesium_polylepis.2